jgi:hypothetical protein
MGGGIIQLTAYGAQDLHLTGNPQITFFKMVYRRHTNFAIETIEQTFNSTPSFGSKSSSTLTKNGDLINRLYLKVVLPAIPSCSSSSTPTYNELNSMAYWIPRIGHNLISSVSIDIGGRQIDSQQGEWMNIYDELSRPANLGKINEGKYDEMIGSIDGETTYIKKSPITKTEYYSDFSDIKGSICETGMPLLTHINNYNKELKITYSSNTYTANITSGIYTGPKITDLIKTNINSVDGLSGFTTSFAKGNNIISISSTESFTILGNSKANTTLGITRNLAGTSVNANTVIFPQEIRLFPLQTNTNGILTLRDNLGNGSNVVESRTIYIPLQFWFCRHPGLALPIIALQDHDVRIHLELKNLTDLFYGWDGGTNGSGIGSLTTCKLYGDYVYLDTDERRRFAQGRHEYLIEQIQSKEETINSTVMKLDLPFNHPIKELIWVIQDGRWITSTTATNFTSNNRGKRYDKEFHEFEIFDSTLLSDTRLPIQIKNGNPLENAKLFINGQERFGEMDEKYFNHVVPYERHTNIPKSKGINVYSFALKPEDQQPSGTLNFSKIDSAQLQLTLNNSNAGKIRVYAVNYNILKITGGMGGIAYSG